MNDDTFVESSFKFFLEHWMDVMIMFAFLLLFLTLIYINKAKAAHGDPTLFENKVKDQLYHRTITIKNKPLFGDVDNELSKIKITTATESLHQGSKFAANEYEEAAQEIETAGKNQCGTFCQVGSPCTAQCRKWGCANCAAAEQLAGKMADDVWVANSVKLGEAKRELKEAEAGGVAETIAAAKEKVKAAQDRVDSVEENKEEKSLEAGSRGAYTADWGGAAETFTNLGGIHIPKSAAAETREFPYQHSGISTNDSFYYKN